jgi:hypothetical protein
LFYGGEKSLGWKIDFEKLYQYLKERFQANQIYYFNGVNIHEFPFNYLTSETDLLKELETCLVEYLENEHLGFDGPKDKQEKLI